MNKTKSCSEYKQNYNNCIKEYVSSSINTDILSQKASVYIKNNVSLKINPQINSQCHKEMNELGKCLSDVMRIVKSNKKEEYLKEYFSQEYDSR